MTLVSRRGSAAVLVALTTILSTANSERTQAALPPDRLDAALQRLLENPGGGPSKVRVILSARPGRLPGLTLSLRLGGHSILNEHETIESVTVELPAAAIAALSTVSLVESVSLDAPTRALASDAAMTPGQVLRGTLGVPDMSYTGAGIGVAVIDSGIHPSAVFGSRISSFYDFTSTGRAVAKAPFDDFGHGTHVAGLIGGSGDQSSGTYAGVAPGVKLVGLKVLDGSGSGYTSAVIAALEFAAKNRESLGIRVVNLSLGHPIYERASRDPLVRAVEAAVGRGLVVVVSAGNQGIDDSTGQVAHGGISSPGNAPSAITVGALNTYATVTRDDDVVAPYSSRGPTWYDGYSKPDLTAPGHALSAATNPAGVLWQNYPALRMAAAGPGAYMRLSGTSMAAAVTSGVVALALEAHQSESSSRPPLSPNAVKALLQYSAVPLSGQGQSASPGGGLAYGAGGINADGAIQLSRRLDTTIPVGGWWLTSGLVPTSVMGGTSTTWGQHVVWGDHVLGGDTVFYNQPAFAEDTTWGSHVVWGDHVVWGESTVWNLERTWGSHVVWGESLIGRIEGDHVVWGDSTFDEISVAWGSVCTSPSKPSNPLAMPQP